jgi:endonuclease/exonuclease/phosphatase family metal-dependent hydrolase
MNFEIFNLTLIILASISYLFNSRYFRHYFKTDQRKKRLILIEILLIVVLATFIPVFMGATFFVLILKNFSYGVMIFRRKVFQEKIREEKQHLGEKLRMVGYSVYTIIVNIILAAFFITGTIGRYLSLDYYYPVSITVGTFVMGFLISNKDIRKKIHFEETPKICNKMGWVSGLFILIILPTSYIGYNAYVIKNRVAPEDNQLDLKFLTFNILNSDGLSNKWPDRKQYLAGFIINQSVDIYGVQEAKLNQLEYLNITVNNRNYNWSGRGRNDGVHDGEHSAIFYDQDKFLLLDEGTFWFSYTPDQPSKMPNEHNYRICSWIKLQEKSTNGTFYVYNTHYGFSFDLQIKASIQINDHIASNTGNLPVILMGDFNMLNFYPFYLYMEGYGEKPLYEAYRTTHGVVNPFQGTTTLTDNINFDIGFHVDYFFVSENVYVDTCTVYKESYDGTNTYSDHHSVGMNCQLPIIN